MAYGVEHKQLLEALREDVSSRGSVANRDYAGRGRRGTFRSDKDTARALRHLWLNGELMTYGRRLVGRADLRIDQATRTLIVHNLWLEHSASARDADLVRAISLGLRRLTEWAGGDYVHIEATSPAGLRVPLA